MTKGISLLLAGGLSIIGLIFPFLLGAQATGLNQSLLMVMMLGVMGAFVHGFGFHPENKWAACVISPALTWPLMLGTLGLLLTMR